MEENTKTELSLSNEELQAIMGGCNACNVDRTKMKKNADLAEKHSQFALGPGKQIYSAWADFYDLLAGQAADRIAARESIPGHDPNPRAKTPYQNFKRP